MLAIVTLGELVDDLQAQRVATENRIRAISTVMGPGWASGGRVFDDVNHIAAGLEAMEHEAVLALQRVWRHHRLAPWAKSVKGAGELSIARLVATIGDPGERPNVDKLKQYCGHGDPARSRPQKGASQADVLACGKPAAKKRVWLIAVALVKRQCPACKAESVRVGDGDEAAREWQPEGCTCAELGMAYRVVYNQTRLHYVGKLHETACVRCGPSGHSAEAGSPWSAAHQHAAGLRKVGKEFLKALWREARAGHPTDDTHGSAARTGQ